jgi:HEAT repeat protein
LLKSGASNPSVDTRRAAVGALGLLIHQRQAAELAENALVDEKPEVRSAAATALGQMESEASIPQLEQTLHDKEPAVVLAAARSLVHLKQESGYDIYYEVLTGKRKAGKGVVASQIDTLKNPKKLAAMGFEEGIGFVPFGGMGLEAFKAIRGASSASVRAAAAKLLTNDSDPAAGAALKDAVGDDSWQVRVAAVDAIAERGDPQLLAAVVPAMSDEKDAVKFTAAAAVLRLRSIESPPRAQHKRR